MSCTEKRSRVGRPVPKQEGPTSWTTPRPPSSFPVILRPRLPHAPAGLLHETTALMWWAPSQAAVLIGRFGGELPVSGWGGQRQLGWGGGGSGRRVAATAVGSGGEGGEVGDWGSPLSPQKAAFQHSPLFDTPLRLDSFSAWSVPLLRLRGHLPPDVSSGNRAVGGLSRRLRAAFRLQPGETGGRHGSSYGVGAWAGRSAGPELHRRGSPLAVLGPEVTERAAGVGGGALCALLTCAVQDASTQAEVLEVSVARKMDGVRYRWPDAWTKQQKSTALHKQHFTFVIIVERREAPFQNQVLEGMFTASPLCPWLIGSSLA